MKMKVNRLLLGVGMFCSVAAGAGTEVVRDGKAVARIYHAPLGQNAEWTGMKAFGKLTISEMDAKSLAISIADLNEHIQKMSGTALEVVETSDPRAVQPPAIVIGELANRMGGAPDIQNDRSRDAFRVKAGERLVLLGGASDFGASHAIYALLEKLGCAWVMPGPEGEIIPQLKTVSVPDMDIQEAPSFAIRNLYYGGRPTALQWQELQMWGLRQKGNIYGTQQRYGFPGGGHAWGALIRKFKKEFEADPTMMGLIRKPDGSLVRGGGQLESTHPRCIELAIENIRDEFKSNGWSNDAAVCIGMGPNDGGSLSLSPETVNAGVPRVNYDAGKLDGTDVCVLFINTILEQTEQEFPNLHLSFMVYSWHADFPMRYKPHPRLVAGIRDLNVSRYHSMDDLTSRSRTYYRDVVRQWGRLALEQGNQISHGDYNWNPAEAVLPYSRVKITGEDFPIYQQAGFQIKSTNLEKSWYLTAAHDYISLKMMWNAGLDWHDLLREFCVKAYGSDAAPIMESYYLDVAQRQSESSHEAGSFFAIPLIYDMAFVTEQEQRFAAATAAAGTEIERKRIDAARYPVLALKQFLAMRSAYATFDFKAACVAFGHATNDLEAITSRNIHFENTSGKRYFSGYGRYLDAACRYSEGAYAIEYAIPNRLKTMIDINNLGAQHRFWGSQMDDSSHLTTETFLSTWDAQGLSGFQQGSAWYRIHFTLNEKAARPGGYGLFVGGAENRVAIWCNDTFIGRSGTGLRSPTLFDITDAVRPGQENLVVIQATRHGISELFVGGLTMPSFVFSGPRVEQAKDTEPAFRILPGGTVELVKPGEMAD